MSACKGPAAEGARGRGPARHGDGCCAGRVTRDATNIAMREGGGGTGRMTHRPAPSACSYNYIRCGPGERTGGPELPGQALLFREAADPLHEAADLAVRDFELLGDLQVIVPLHPHFQNQPVRRPQPAEEMFELVHEGVGG